MRRSFRMILISTMMTLGACAGDNAQAPLSVVSPFDAERYVGKWHQVAAVPAWFQRDCISDTSATYSLQDDGNLSVLNACKKADGEMMDAEGRARFIESPQEAKLEVTFLNVLGFWMWFASGDYWVIGLDPDYQWAVVGDPSREYGWVLAREPILPTETLDQIRELLADKDYDPCRFQLSVPNAEGSLCS